MALLKDVEALPKGDLPTMPERYRGPSPKGAVGDLIRVLLKSVAEQHGVAARILATSDDIDALVEAVETIVANGPSWTYRLDAASGEYTPDPETRDLPNLRVALSAEGPGSGGERS